MFRNPLQQWNIFDNVKQFPEPDIIEDLMICDDPNIERPSHLGEAERAAVDGCSAFLTDSSYLNQPNTQDATSISQYGSTFNSYCSLAPYNSTISDFGDNMSSILTTADLIPDENTKKSFTRYACEDCPKSYTKHSSLMRHVENHNPNGVWDCGHCDESVHSSELVKSSRQNIRTDKVYEHIRKFHPDDTEQLVRNEQSGKYRWPKCERGKCQSQGTLRGKVFGNREALEQHLTMHHGGEGPEIDSVTAQSMDELDPNPREGDGINEFQTDHDKFEQYTQESGCERNTFRSRKRATETTASSHGKKKRTSGCFEETKPSSVNSTSGQCTQSDLAEKVKKSNLRAVVENVGENSVIKISEISPRELLEMADNDAIKEIETELVSSTAEYVLDLALEKKDRLDGMISVDILQRLMRIQGPSTLVKRAFAAVEFYLKSVRGKETQAAWNATPTSIRREQMYNQLIPKSSSDLKLYPLEERDQTVAGIWASQVVPKLHDILKELGDTYQASIVRQGREQSQTHLTIRIQSPAGCTEDLGEDIWGGIKKLFGDCGLETVPTILFSRGSILPAAAIDREPEIKGNDWEIEDARSFGKIPHQKRYWKRAGMGASLGMAKDRIWTSATLGGLILFEDKLCVLTVKHFVPNTDARSNSEHGQMIASVESPSFSHRSEACAQTQVISNNITLRLKKNYPYEIPLSKLLKENRKLVDQNEYLKKWRRENDESRGPDAFAFGRLLATCQEIHSEYQYDDSSIHRTMDWAVIQVKNYERKGKNMHRFPQANGVKFEDPEFFDCEAPFEYGIGPIITNIAKPEQGQRVRYVGAGTGFKTGKVGTEVCSSVNGTKSREWSLILDTQYQYRPSSKPDNSAYAGDSGAWILDEQDRAIGMIIAEQDGKLLFTPLQDIFEDIHEQCNVPVRLPLPRRSPWDSPSRRNVCLIESSDDIEERRRRLIQTSWEPDICEFILSDLDEIHTDLDASDGLQIALDQLIEKHPSTVTDYEMLAITRPGLTLEETRFKFGKLSIQPISTLSVWPSSLDSATCYTSDDGYEDENSSIFTRSRDLIVC